MTFIYLVYNDPPLHEAVGVIVPVQIEQDEGDSEAVAHVVRVALAQQFETG